jgi:hypothetical protein
VYLIQAVIELEQGDSWVSSVKNLLLESDVDDDVKQELLEHTIGNPINKSNHCSELYSLVMSKIRCLYLKDMIDMYSEDE